MHRRDFIRIIAFGTVPLFISLRKTIAQSKPEVENMRKFQWRVPKAHYETIKNELSFDGKIEREKDAKGVSLMFIFIGAVLVPSLARAVLALRREIVHGGVVIDTRGDEIVIDTDKSLPGGVIVIVTPEGTQYHERDDIGNPTELVSALMKGL